MLVGVVPIGAHHPCNAQGRVLKQHIAVGAGLACQRILALVAICNAVLALPAGQSIRPDWAHVDALIVVEIEPVEAHFAIGVPRARHAIANAV